MMRFSYAALPFLALVASSVAAADIPGGEATVRSFIESFNRGDLAAAKATNLPDVSITDDFAPFSWAGTGSFDRWLAALMVDSKARGMSGNHVTLEKPIRESTIGDRSYMIVPAFYSFRQKGLPFGERGQLTFSLIHQPAGWKIASWTWTGSNPSPVR